ncbi:hypothetical protein [Leifsonia sp. P73]|uniref:hypothetical protein n=1 Tax=Leifsonia sp. P73 TaxID=3423959 RepID=UPI003DA4B6EB
MNDDAIWPQAWPVSVTFSVENSTSVPIAALIRPTRMPATTAIQRRSYAPSRAAIAARTNAASAFQAT